MKLFLLTCFSAFLFSCNSSSSKKDGDKQNNDSTTTNDKVSRIISPVSITAAQIPPGVKFDGKLQEAWQWTDKLGDNILVTSYIEPYDDKEKSDQGDEGKTAKLNAFHYVKKDGSYQLLWKVNDEEKSCPFDITCEFIKGATTVTDLDKNGIAETTVQYRLACRSDVSPAEMKLIMHENNVSYSLRGLSWLKSSPEDKFTVTEKDVNLETLPGYKKTQEEYMQTFGRYESEKNFAGAPAEFLNYARQQWMKYVKEITE